MACLNCIPIQSIIKLVWRRQRGVFEHLSCAVQHSLFPSGLCNPGKTYIPIENEKSDIQVSGEFSGHLEGRELTVDWHGQM